MGTPVRIKHLFPDDDLPPPNIIRPTSLVWKFLPVMLLVLGLGLALNQTLQRQRIFTRASGGAVLSLSPEKDSVHPGEVFTVNLLLDPHGAAIRDVYLAIDYPVEDLELLDAGQTHRSLHFTSVPGQVEIITAIRFLAIRPVKKATISYSSETWVAGENKENLLNKTFGTVIEIK